MKEASAVCLSPTQSHTSPWNYVRFFHISPNERTKRLKPIDSPQFYVGSRTGMEIS
jgi:hypothetical protein